VPRELWNRYEDQLGPKPVPLSLLVAPQSRLPGVTYGKITLPPGVLGYARAEGGFYALLIYGVFFGQFTRFFDEIVRQNYTNPFLVLAVGCALGDLIGLARGDLAIFANFNWLGFL